MQRPTFRRRRKPPETKPETSPEREGMEEIDAPDKPGASEKAEDSTQFQDTETSVSSDQQEEEPTMGAALNIETASEDELLNAIDDVLERLSIEYLVRVRGLVDHRISDKREETRAELLAKFRAQAAEAGMSLFEVIPQQPKSARKSPIKAQFRGPNGEEYSGRGVNPRWLEALVKEGRSKEDFRIQDDGKTTYERHQIAQET